MAVAGCELRRGDDGTMRARDKESHRGLALSYRIHILHLVFHSSKLLLFSFLLFFISFFSFLFFSFSFA